MRLGRRGFLGIAVLFHLVYIYSIFDIYFVSPISHGMQPFQVDQGEAPAQRLVLFVGDGLRADKAFQKHIDPSPADSTLTHSEPLHLAPFLRSRVLHHGTFGVSHTRVPTESRPGHVALIAGLYEDVSAVTTGWKINPVHFDSVFNRSRHTWSWGSPDIIPMFAEGATPGRVDAFTYPPEIEDFSKDATQLDYWVFDRVKELFRKANRDTTLEFQLRRDKNVFFLHLLGLDTTGHAYRPYSREYLHNIKVVDQGVQEITQLFNTFFPDNKTAFVFTADHGMSDWGSHGDGHPDNTRTPLIAWGSGVAKPKLTSSGSASGHDDGFSSDWDLDNVQRNDVAQADIAALMAYLAGLQYPVNSVGELPLQYLSANIQQKAKALLVNARGILEIYNVKEQSKIATEIRYRPFHGFASADHSVQARLEAIQQAIDDEDYERAIYDTDALIKLGLQGLRYLQTYDWLFLQILVTASYLGWVAFAFTFALDQNVLGGQYQANRSLSSAILFVSVQIALFSLLLIKSSPWTYYAYTVFPVAFWEEVYARRSQLRQGVHILMHQRASPTPSRLVLELVTFVGLLEIMVQSYYRRTWYTPIYLALCLWPLSHGTGFVRQNMASICIWIVSCVSMGIFTLLPAIKSESLRLINLGGTGMLLVGIVYLIIETQLLHDKESTSFAVAQSNDLSRALIGVQIGLVGLAMLVTKSSVSSLQAKTGLPLGTQVTGWVVLFASLLVPFAHGLQPNKHYLHRLVILFLAFAPMFVILSISYEGLFYLAYACTLVTWVRLEHRVYRYSRPDAPKSGTAVEKQPNQFRALTLSDTRIALFFLFFLQSGFFSTGNIASVSSFSLDAVYRLIPVFDPFSQGALLILKILAPFVLVSANLGILTKRLRLRGGALFAIVMGIGDWLTLRFFWSVRDEGSWLEIGESISVFAIASSLCVFVAALEMVSQLIVKGVEFNDEVNPDAQPADRQTGKEPSRT